MIRSVFLGILLCAVPAFAETDQEACERLLTAAEEVSADISTHSTDVYTTCGFDNETRAWNTWAPFAAAHNMKRAMFELCTRYPSHQYGLLYCQKAAELNYGPALLYFGDINFRNNNEAQALSYYARAISAGDLSADQICDVHEKTGLLYLREDSPVFNSSAGIALLFKAAKENSPVAANALAYLIYGGKYGLAQSSSRTLEFLWRAILLGCPAAEENLGAFHLARQGKITADDALYYMSLQAFTCTPAEKTQSESPAAGCNCAQVFEQESLFAAQPYRYTEMTSDNRAVLESKSGDSRAYALGDVLDDGSVVREIRPAMVALTRAGKRILINKYQKSDCLDKCQLAKSVVQRKPPVAIRPYHLTFTKQECADIQYYAEKLVDTTGPYTGKKECGRPELDDTAKALLGL